MAVPDDLPFARYTDYDPRVPVWCITPGRAGCIHRFFDTSPISPSGRYVAVTRLPTEARAPRLGDVAEVVLVDLRDGSERVVAETRGFEAQMGANIGWGGSDTELFFNDVVEDEWRPFAWKLDVATGERQRLGGTLYQASPDGRQLASCDTTAMRRTQAGYGVIVPDACVRRNFGLADDDGLYLTDTQTGECKLAVSIRDVVDTAGPVELQQHADDFEVYGFHTKWNRQGDRLILTLRWYRRDERGTTVEHMRSDLRFAVYTLRPDGGDLHLAIGPEHWARRGHHINWQPDGRTLSANLGWPEGDETPLRLIRCSHDGADLRPMTGALLGSGHPTVHPCGKVLADTYTHEQTSFGDGTIPLRWIDPDPGTEQCLVRINTAQPVDGSVMRVDAHPAWCRDWRWVAFNGYVDGGRRVFLADLSGVIG